jgi:hypothetical protein
LSLHQSSYLGARLQHSCLNTPLDVNDTSHCNLLQNSPKVQLLKQIVAIIWDEVPMQHRYCTEVVGHNMQGILGNNSPFGGIVVLWGGGLEADSPNG